MFSLSAPPTPPDTLGMMGGDTVQRVGSIKLPIELQQLLWQTGGKSWKLFNFSPTLRGYQPLRGLHLLHFHSFYSVRGALFNKLIVYISDAVASLLKRAGLILILQQQTGRMWIVSVSSPHNEPERGRNPRAEKRVRVQEEKERAMRPKTSQPPSLHHRFSLQTSHAEGCEDRAVLMFTKSGFALKIYQFEYLKEKRKTVLSTPVHLKLAKPTQKAFIVTSLPAFLLDCFLIYLHLISQI